MRILVTTHVLRQYTGSELVALDVATGLARQGHEVSLAAFVLEEPLKGMVEASGLEFILLGDCMAGQAFDLVWAFHFITIDACRFDHGFTAAHWIFHSLSPFEPIECPPLYCDRLALLLANSYENRDSLAECGLEPVEVFPNSVAQSCFGNTGHLHQPMLSRVAIVSNHIPRELLAARRLLQDKGIRVDVIGLNFEVRLVEPSLLASYDAVISIGRTVQQALAGGVPVFCYDRFGGPGYISRSNFEEAAYFNFSGRCCEHRMSASDIVQEAIAGFQRACDEAETLKGLAAEQFNLDANLARIMRLLEQHPAARATRAGTVEKLLRRQRQHHLRRGSIHDLWIQVFLDTGFSFNEEDSLLSPIRNESAIQTFQFDLSPATTIHRIRVDPVNESAVVEVEEISLTTSIATVNLLPRMASNASLLRDGQMLFQSRDPQIHLSPAFPGEFQDATGLTIRLKYLLLGREAESTAATLFQHEQVRRIDVLQARLHALTQVRANPQPDTTEPSHHD